MSSSCRFLYPERVQGLVVLDIAPVAYTTREAHWQAIHEIIEACANIPPGVYSKKEVDTMLQQDVPDPALRAFLLTNYGEKEWKIPMECIRNELEKLAGFDIPSNCQYTGDVFVIHGGQSDLFDRDICKRFKTTFPITCSPPFEVLDIGFMPKHPMQRLHCSRDF